MNKFLFSSLSILILCSFFLYAPSSKENISSNLKKYKEEFYPDKVYLHTDKNMYALEDTVWIKTYLVNGITHLSNSKSKVVHIDLVGPDQKVIESHKVYSDTWGASSDIILNRELGAGTFTISAYTQHGLNYSEDHVFTKSIKVFDINAEIENPRTNSTTSEIKIDKPSRTRPEIEFYPEGGYLVEGLQNKVAIKVKNAAQDFEGLNGEIIDDEDEVVSRFKLYQFGLSSVSFTPKRNRKYYLKINLNGKDELYQMPKSEKEGYVMSLNNKFDKMSIQIKSNLPQGLDGAYILGHLRGMVFFEKQIEQNSENEFGFIIPTKDLGVGGVAHFTLFDKNGIPRCERLAFIDNTSTAVELETNKTAYNKREKVKLDVMASNEFNDNNYYNCSISIVEKNNNALKTGDNIKTWMLLNSDLRGEIEEPSYFFEEQKDYKRFFLLDLVMMTNGWRRFSWETIQSDTAFINITKEREDGIYVKGYTTGTWNKNKAVKSNVLLTFLDQSLSEDNIVSDDEGQFQFGPYILTDSITGFIQARRYKEKNEKLEGKRNLEIHLKENLSKPSYEKINLPEVEKEALETYLNNNKYAQMIKDQYYQMSVTLDEFVVTAKRDQTEEKLDKIQKANTYYGEPSNRVILEDTEMGTYFSAFEMLRAVPGVSVVGSPPSQSVRMRGPSSFNASGEPLFLIDGVRGDASFINSLNPNDVLFIDVLKGANAAIFGSEGSNGVIAFYTGRRGSSVTDRKPGIINFELYGFHAPREFYSPEYASKASRVFTPDIRSTLFWDSNVRLKQNEAKTLEFYSGDITGTFDVILEGMAADGEPIHSQFEFTVNQ